MKPLSLNKKNAFWKIGICALALVATAGFWWTRPPSALERATKIVTVPEWRGGKSSSPGGYSWVVNGDLLTFTLDEKGGATIFQHSSGTSRLMCKLKNNQDALISKLEQLAAQGDWVEEISNESSTNFLKVRRIKDGFTRTYRLAPSGKSDSKVNIRPFWSLDKKTLYYIDSGGTKLHRLKPDIDSNETFPVETLSSTLSLSLSGQRLRGVGDDKIRTYGYSEVFLRCKTREKHVCRSGSHRSDCSRSWSGKELLANQFH